MNKLYYLMIISTLIIISSCRSDYDKTLDTLSKKYKTILNDNAFKNNQTIDFIEYLPINFEISNENYLDSIRILNNADALDYFSDLYSKQVEKVKKESQRYRLYSGMFGSKDNITIIQKEDYEDALKKSYEYRDSCQFYLNCDSILRQQIKERTNPAIVYQFKVYIKATIKDNINHSTENIADTVNCLFDKNYNIIILR